MWQLHYSHRYFSKKIIGFLFVLSISGCSAVVEPVKLTELSPNPKLQEEFSVELLPLTFAAVDGLNKEPYSRLVSQPGSAFSANVISEKKAIERNEFPFDEDNYSYRLGVGDEITLVQSADKALSINDLSANQNIDSLLTPQPAPNAVPLSSIISTTGRIANDGSLLLIGIGRLEAKGRHLTDLQNEVRSILIRNGSPPNFQLEIAGFNSQKAFITTDGEVNQNNNVLPITDQGTSLREIIASAGIAFNERVFTIVKIQRGGKTFPFSLADIFAEDAREIYLKDRDHVLIQNLEYVKGKVFLVGGVEPRIIEIQPELRTTLAEILFAPKGPLAEPTAQRSAVYLLRGHNPVKAYHLDAQNPARIFVADAVEMRPNDIVYVAEQPINTFNRMISTIFPLRVFSRDIQNKNFP